MKREFNTAFPVLGGEYCAGCYKKRTNMWNSTKDVPVCYKCKNIKVRDLPGKSEWFQKSRECHAKSQKDCI